MGAEHDLIVLSDLHLGRGKNPETGRYYTLETFFFDRDFVSFCTHLCRNASPNGFKMIFAGDTFDFLRIEDHETNTPELLRDILTGHSEFILGLCHVLMHGHTLIFLPGNHDFELQQHAVQQELFNAIRKHFEAQEHPEKFIQQHLQRVCFHPWFYYEPQRIWIEHGCQYDAENAFQYWLRNPHENPEDIQNNPDVPLGNFFQRYLYNAFGHMTFIVPSARANVRYLKWLLLNDPKLLSGVLLRHGPFALRMIQRLATQPLQNMSRLETHYHEQLKQLTSQHLSTRQLEAINDLKESNAHVVQAVRSMGKQLLKLLGWVALWSVCFLVLWGMGFSLIMSSKPSFWFQVIEFFMLNLALAAVGVGTLSYLLFKQPEDIPAKPLRQAADKISKIVDVPLVCLGHSHDEEVVRIKHASLRKNWYYNTGTWISVFTHDVLAPRERVQYTYLHVQNQEAQLLHYSPGRAESLPVILLDDDRPFSSSITGG